MQILSQKYLVNGISKKCTDVIKILDLIEFIKKNNNIKKHKSKIVNYIKDKLKDSDLSQSESESDHSESPISSDTNNTEDDVLSINTNESENYLSEDECMKR